MIDFKTYLPINLFISLEIRGILLVLFKKVIG